MWYLHALQTAEHTVQTLHTALRDMVRLHSAHVQWTLTALEGGPRFKPVL